MYRLQEFVERVLAALGLIAFSPLIAAATIAVLAEDGRPVLFRQKRIGRLGKPFELLKFRSMRTRGAGTKITAARDARVTRTGALLRRFKIDELPQLWNVVRGDMGLIGPRPEIPEFVDLKDGTWRRVLEVKPGISDLATLIYRDEEKLLSAATETERFYQDSVLPGKLALSLHYLKIRSFWTDLQLLALTVRYSFVPAGFDPRNIRRQFHCEEDL